MAASQDHSTFSPRSVAVSRRHSTDGTLGLGSGSDPGREPVPSDRFHPYRRQFSSGAEAGGGCLQQSSPSFSQVTEECSPDDHSHRGDASSRWDQNKGGVQSSYSDLPAAPVENSSFRYSSYSSPSPLQQVSSRLYLQDESSHSKYSLHSLSAPSHQDSPTLPLFPKPLYSYSILIFLALKSSKMGSLPVSEIYRFMTEHFPYFKTAPDGWKNSVRHNLSLNKCFEKVENKNGNSSRKGCLWALNPAKVEKMQEELHKWRRKDPVTMRRSMAKPEDLDRLLGQRPDRLRSLLPYTSSALPPRVSPIYSCTPSYCPSVHHPPPCSPIRRSHYAHVPLQQPLGFLPPAAHPGNSFSLYSPCGHQPAPTGSLNSPIAGKMPPIYSAALQADCSAGMRSMQELLLEGDASYDIDTLNPSLTDLQLQGNLWDELRDDSLNQASAQQVTTTNLSIAPVMQDHHLQTPPPPVSHLLGPTATGRCKEECEDEDSSFGPNVEQHGCLSGLHPAVYSGVESLAGYLTSCTTPISLM